MTIYHNAYLFDAPGYMQSYAERCGHTKDNTLDIEALYNWARTVIPFGSDLKRKIIEDLRFEENWLSPPGSDKAETDLWSLISLVNAVEKQVPGLSNRLESSYYVLQHALPLLGWSPARTHVLIFGQPLSTLYSGKETSLSDATTDRNYDSGWLSRGNAESLMNSLKMLEEKILAPPDEIILELKEYADQRSQSVSSVLQAAYNDAIDMLICTRRYDRDLFLVLIQ